MANIALDSTFPAATTSLEAAAAIALNEDAQQTRAAAREQRRAAQDDVITTMHRAADKLRDMASWSIASGLFRATIGGLSAYCTLRSAAIGLGGAGEVGKAAKIIDATQRRLSGISQALQAGQQLDPFAMGSQHAQADKQQIEIGQRRAEQRQQNAADNEREAGRVEQSALRRQEDIIRVQHEIQRATLEVR